MTQQRILFSSVFGPYGIKDEYAEGLGMQMELLNNQVTRAQGIHSPRQSYLSFALYLLAENISVPSTVLDFPSWNEFTNELERGYTHLALSFIVPNALKAGRMTRYVREHYPQMKIILGGYGTIIPDLDDVVPHDDCCRGEGVAWLRKYFGDDEQAPLVHPVLRNPVYNYTYGIPSRPRGSVLLTGAGCKNGCSFCITSHMFRKEYLPLLETGADVFNACHEIEQEIGAVNFMVMDENFLMQQDRACELLRLMESRRKTYSFVLFCSANIIRRLGVDFFVRMGITRVWVGVESKINAHDKVRGIDLRELFEELRSRGIAVLASTIMFQDHHDADTMRDEVDWVISLGSDMVQFMNYTPWPGTDLYKSLEEQGRLRPVPYRHQHGAGELGFEHPFYTRAKDHERELRRAFRLKYRTDGPALLAMAHTAARGYAAACDDVQRRARQGLVWNSETLCYEQVNSAGKDEYMLLRLEAMRSEAVRYRPVLLPSLVFGPTFAAKIQALRVMRLYRTLFGRPRLKDIAAAMVVLAGASKEIVLLLANRLAGRESVIIQPPCVRSEYPGQAAAAEKSA